MADAGHDAAQGDAHGRLGFGGGFLDGMQIFAPCPQIAVAAEIGRQEGFGINHTAFGAFFQHGQRQGIKILRALQGGDRRFIDFKKMPEIGEFIGPVLGEQTRQIHVFPLGQAADERRRRGPLQMQVKFDLGLHKKLFPGPREATPRWAASEAPISTKPHSPI